MDVIGDILSPFIWPHELDGQITDMALRAYPVFGMAATMVVTIGLLVISVWICRTRTEEMTVRRRVIMTALRVGAICCLIPLLFEWSLQVNLQRQVRPVLAIAIDTSESMNLEDRYITPKQQKDLSSAIGRPLAQSPSEPVALSRMELVAGLLSAQMETGHSRLEELAQAADLQVFSFHRNAEPLTIKSASDLNDQIEATGSLTSLSTSINEIASRLRGQPTAGILLLSDGANNSGGSPLADCEQWKKAGIAVHTVTIGDPDPKDIDIRQVLANEQLFSGEPTTVIARIRQRGFRGVSLPVILRNGRKELVRAEAHFAEGVSEINLPITFTPTEPGEQTFRIECPPQAGEIVEQNNRKSFVAQVTTERIRVLYIESRPRWQYRFLRDAMKRDRRLDVRILLTGAEKVNEPPPPFIAELPGTKEGLKQFDLIMIGDVDPAIMSEEQIEWISELVRDDGVGLILLAGPIFNPRAYLETPLLDLYPVEPGEAPRRSAGRPRAKEEDRFVPLLTPLGQSHPAMQLADEPATHAEIWKNLPGLYWFAPVNRSRPGALVLATHPTETSQANPDEQVPLIALQRFGRGKSFYCGLDETWRWRLKQGDQVFYRFWGQVIQDLGAPHLGGDKERIHLWTDRNVYHQGATALVTARGEELPGNALPVLVAEHEDGQQQRMTMIPSPGTQNLYETRVSLNTAGLSKLWIDGHALEATAVIEVRAPQLESQEPAANETLMKQIADNTDGRRSRPGNFAEFVRSLDLSPRVIHEQRNLPLWDRPLVAMLFVGLLGAEWILRRLWHLP